MKVMKFGGTSVGSVNSILSVKRIVESAGEPVIVVVSALGGITDKLINTSKMAAAGDSAYEGEFREIVYRHVEMIKEVIPAGAGQVALQRQIGELLNELKDIFQGIYLIRDLSPKTSDTIVSYGERLSSIIVAELIDEAKWFDSRTFIKTEKKHNKHTIDADLTNQLVKEAFHSIPKVSLVPGFISSDKVSGDVTNLGRGGSDYTAAIIAAALDAGSLEIWTDVDGFMTADPRVISTAYTISELSYVEATELCNFGAKVVYPPTIYPVCHKNIPIIIKNTFNPDGVGTVIKQETSNPQSKAIKGISFEVNEGEVIALIGANGAGKTTTLQTITGMLQPKAGEIIFEGKDISKIPGHKIVSMGMAHVPEGRRVFAELSVYENLKLGAYTRKDKKEIEETLARVYKSFPRLEERKNQLAGTLSGGEQQMLAMGRALMSKPKIILMDEPSMGLSPILVEEIFHIIREISAGGTTVLLVEQNAKKALAIADRAYVLETGNIVLSGDAKEMMNNDSIKKAYLGE